MLACQKTCQSLDFYRINSCYHILEKYTMMVGITLGTFAQEAWLTLYSGLILFIRTSVPFYLHSPDRAFAYYPFTWPAIVIMRHHNQTASEAAPLCRKAICFWVCYNRERDRPSMPRLKLSSINRDTSVLHVRDRSHCRAHSASVALLHAYQFNANCSSSLLT